MGEACSSNGEKRNAYRLLAGNPEGRRPLVNTRRRWVNIIKMDLEEIEWRGVDWIGLAQDRDKRSALVNAVMNLRVVKMLGINRVSAQLETSRIVLSSIELVKLLSHLLQVGFVLG
jgi:hypothetical protein